MIQQRYKITFQNGAALIVPHHKSVAVLELLQQEYGCIKTIEKHVEPREPRAFSMHVVETTPERDFA